MVATKNVRKNRNGGKKATADPVNGPKSGLASKSKLNFKPKTPQANSAVAVAAAIKAKSLIKPNTKRPVPVSQPRSSPSSTVQATVPQTPAVEQSNNGCCCCCQSSSNCPKECTDNSVVREPINSGRKGAKQILDSVRNGTAEVRDLLFNECEIIIECRICRQLFRSTTNFLLHKREYCLGHACENMVLFDETTFTYREETADKVSEPEPSEVARTEELTIVDEVVPTSAPEPDPEPERVVTVIETKKANKMKALQECLNKLAADKLKQSECGPKLALTITTITSNPNAVYQERMTEDLSNDSNDDGVEPGVDQDQDMVDSPACSSNIAVSTTASSPNSSSSDSADRHPHIKVTVKVPHSSNPSHKGQEGKPGTKRVRKQKRFLDEHDAAAAPEALSGSVRLAPSVSTSSTLSTSVTSSTSTGSGQVTCGECGSIFISKKTLRVHNNTIHAVQRLLYPCPFCCMTFKQLCNATRHMITVHKKSRSDVKRLREVVKYRATPLGDENPDDADEDDRSGDSDGDDQEDGEASSSPKAMEVVNEVEEEEEVEEDETGPAEKEEDQVDEDMDEDVEDEEEEEAPQHPVVSTLTNESIMRTRRQAKESASLPDQELKENEDANDGNGTEFQHTCKGCGKAFSRIQSKQSHERACRAHKAMVLSNATVAAEHVAVVQTLFAEQQNSNSFDTFRLTHPIEMNEETRNELSKIVNVTSLHCSLCPDQSFTSPGHLIKHAVTHFGLTVLKCCGCFYQAVSRADMSKHLGVAHKINERVRDRFMINLSASVSCTSPQSAPKLGLATVLTPLLDEGSTVEESNNDETFMPPPLYDSRLSPVSSSIVSPTNSPSSSSTSGSLESSGVTSSGDTARIKLVFQRKPGLTTSSHSKKSRGVDIYAVSKVEDCPLEQSANMSSSSE